MKEKFGFVMEDNDEDITEDTLLELSDGREVGEDDE